MKEVAFRIQSKCGTYEPDTHIRFIGGARDGEIVRIEHAGDVVIDESVIFVMEIKSLSLVDIASGESI